MTASHPILAIGGVIPPVTETANSGRLQTVAFWKQNAL